MYMTTRARISFIMELIRPELSELSALEFENLPYLTMFTLLHLQILTQSLSSANIDQSAPNLVKIFMSQQNLNEFDHRSDWTGTTGVICS